MLAALDSNWWQVVGPIAVAALAVWAGWRERRHRRARPREIWPPFWFLTAAVLVFMALGQAGGLGDLIADIGRREVRAEGWYDSRRGYQAAAVALISATWIVVTLVAVWRFPERRRRYLPMTVVIFSLMCFAAIRILSLHQIDALLYRTDVVGIRVVDVIELFGLSVAAATTFWQPRRRDDAATSPSRFGSHAASVRTSRADLAAGRNPSTPA